MEFLLLTKDELKTIYNERLIYDFPDDEVKPLTSMYHMMDRGCYTPYLIAEDGTPIGYALFVSPKDMNSILLDYFSIFKEFRNDGKGGQVLSLIRGVFKDKVVFIESENPEFQDEPEIPSRRLNFYKRNGCVDSLVLTSIFTVNYVNLYIADKKYDSDYCKNEITKIYKSMVLDKKQYEENIII